MTEEDQITALADKAAIAVLKLTLARSGGQLRGPYGVHESENVFDFEILGGFETMAADWLRMAKGGEPRRKEKDDVRESLDALWAIVRAHGIGALRDEGDARYPDEPIGE